MPLKRTPTKKSTTAKPVSPIKYQTRSKSPLLTVNVPMSAAAEAAKNAAAAAAAAKVPAGISPDFLMYMQMQEKKEARAEQIRLEDLARMEAARKEDRDRAEQNRYAQQKAHEAQIQMLTQQLAAAKVSSKSTSKMPLFDLEKDQETFLIWLSRWQLHIQGHGLTAIADPEERRNRLLMELTASLTDSTLAWIASKGFDHDELGDYKFLLKAMEEKISRTSNPLVHQVELQQMQQFQHESADSLIQRIQEKAAKCKLQSVKNVTDHLSMITLIKAVQPEVRRKMLLQKVSTFEDACDILKNEEQATSDSNKCSYTRSQMQEAEGNAISGYKKDQKVQHNVKFNMPPKESLENFKPACCIRCHSKDHMAHQCPAINKTCNKCQKPGHLSFACLNKSRPRRHSDSEERPRSGRAAESHSVVAGTSTCWGYDPVWVKSLIETTIHNDAVDARASNVTAAYSEDEEEGNLGGW